MEERLKAVFRHMGRKVKKVARWKIRWLAEVDAFKAFHGSTKKKMS